MPLVRIEVRQGRTEAEKRALLEAVHVALVEALGIPDHDRTQMIREYAPEDLEIPPGKTEKFTLVEIALFAGRSLDAKRRLYQAIVRNHRELGIAPDDIMIVLHESPLENWGIRGGRPPSEVDLGFAVDL